MFSKETYVSRRAELKKLVKSGIIILFGNNDSPANYPNNAYSPFRQDSSFLYYFGQKRDGLVGIIDIDNDMETVETKVQDTFLASLSLRHQTAGI